MARAGPSLRDGGALVAATTALLIVIVGRLPDLVPPLDGVPLVKLLTIGAVLLYLASPRLVRAPFGRSAIMRLIFTLAALASASVAWSYWRGTSVAVLVGSFAAILAVVTLVYKTATRLETLETYLKALAWAGAALTLGGLLFRAEGRLSFGRTYDPNDLAFVLIAILPVTLALWRLASGPRAWLWGLIAAASVWIILLTQSRGGLLGLLVACSYLGAVGAWRSRFDARPHLWRVVVGWLLLAVLAVGAWGVLPDDARLRYTTMLDPTADYNYTAQREGRVAVWGRGLHTLAAVPWGVGVGAYEMAEMSRSGYWRTAHNSMLELGVELGIFGLGVYLVLLVRVWRVLGRVIGSSDAVAAAPAGAQLRRRHRRTYRGLDTTAIEHADERWRIHAQHLRASFVGMLVAGFFLSQAYAVVAFALYAIVAVLEQRFVPRRSRAAATRARASPFEERGVAASAPR